MLTPQNRKWWIVAAMSLPLIIITLDFFGVAVALPSIGRDLNTSTTSLEWVLNAFMLGFAAPMIAVGRLGDIIGRRKTLLLGLVLYALSSLICGAAESARILILGRALQGLGSSLYFVASLSIVSNAFSAAERGMGIGIWTTIGAIGQSAGPLVGGYLTQALSWRWFFFVNIPIAAAAVLLSLYAVEESRDESAPRSIDFPGLLTVTTGFVLLTLGIQMSNDVGWEAPSSLGAAIAGILFIAAFIVIDRSSKNPLIEFNLFEGRDFLSATGVAFCGNFVFGALMFFLTLYLQHILDYSPLMTGVIFLACTLPFAGLSTVAGKSVGSWGVRRALVLGMFLLVVCLVLFTRISIETGLGLVIAGMVLFGVGESFAYNVSTTAGMLAVSEQKAGAASGVQSLIRQLGIVFGISVGGAVFKAAETSKMVELMNRAAAPFRTIEMAEVRNLLSGSDAAQSHLATLAPGVAHQVEHIVSESFLYGFNRAMWLTLALSIVGLAISFLYKQSTAPAPPAPGAPKSQN